MRILRSGIAGNQPIDAHSFTYRRPNQDGIGVARPIARLNANRSTAVSSASAETGSAFHAPASTAPAPGCVLSAAVKEAPDYGVDET